MQYIDQTGLYALEDALIDLSNQNKKILLVNVLNQPRALFERIGIIPNLVPEEQIFDTFKDCLKWLEKNVEVKN